MAIRIFAAATAPRQAPRNCAVEAAVTHQALYAGHREQYGKEVDSVIQSGLALPVTVFQEILIRRAAFRAKVDAAFETFDLLLTLVQPYAAITLSTIATLDEQPESWVCFSATLALSICPAIRP